MTSGQCVDTPTLARRATGEAGENIVSLITVKAANVIFDERLFLYGFGFN